MTLKFRRKYEIDDLAPAKLTVYPTMASQKAKEAYKLFFYMNGTTLQHSLQMSKPATNGMLNQIHSFLLVLLYQL